MGDALHHAWLQYLMSPACLSELSEKQVEAPRHNKVLEGGEKEAGHSRAHSTESVDAQP